QRGVMGVLVMVVMETLGLEVMVMPEMKIAHAATWSLANADRGQQQGTTVERATERTTATRTRCWSWAGGAQRERQNGAGHDESSWQQWQRRLAAWAEAETF